MMEFVRYEDGSCALLEDDELVWSSDSDDEFLEEFDAVIDPEEIDEVIEYLEDEGYLDEGETLDITDEADTGTKKIRTH